MEFTEGNIDMGHFWYTNFGLQAPSPPRAAVGVGLSHMSHPLFPTKATPALQVITTPATPKVKKAKHEPLRDAPHTPLLPKILDFSFFAILSPEPACVPHNNAHALI